MSGFEFDKMDNYHLLFVEPRFQQQLVTGHRGDSCLALDCIARPALLSLH